MMLFNFAFTFIFSFFTPAIAAQPALELKTQPGYQVELFADVPYARSFAVGKNGTIFIGTKKTEVYAVHPKTKKIYTIVTGMKLPNGIAFRDGALYIAEVLKIHKLPDIESKLENPPKPVLIYDQLPTEGGHEWRYIRFAPDGSLYVSIGMPCDICEKEDKRLGSLLRFKKLDGSKPEIFSTGLRNSVGFEWQPGQPTKLWITDNGVDNLGDALPADELNIATKAGTNFGFPYCHAGDISDAEYGKKFPCSHFTPPAYKFESHVAPLGMRFVNKNTILVALHGSTYPTKGCRVVQLDLSGDKVIKETPFLWGFFKGVGESNGCPADVEILKDGSILVSNSEGGVYRVFKKR